MKRTIGLLALSLVLNGALAGCGDTNTGEEPPPQGGNTVGQGMEDMAKGAGEVARGAIDGINDAARNAENELENAARNARRGWDGSDPVPGGYNGYGWGPDGSIMENGSYYSYNLG